MSATARDIEDAIDATPNVFAVQIEGLNVKYGATHAVRNLSMHVPHGSVYGVVGPTGAGKSSVLRIVATVQPPGSGSVLLDGVDVSANPEVARERIGYLPDFWGTYGGLTVAEDLDFFGAIYRVRLRRRQQACDELLQLFGLEDRRNDPVGILPRGQKQKLGLARCLVHDPDILLLDEPASGLDAASRLELREILQQLAGFGKTVVVSSHLLSEMAEVCTHLGVMREGELLVEASLDDIVSAVLPETYLRVELLDPGDVEPAARLIAAYPSLTGAESVDGTTVLAAFSGGESDLAALLGQLLRSGIRVTEFTLERPSLEDAYLRLTGREAVE